MQKKDNIELFKRALSDALDLNLRKTVEEDKDIEAPELSIRHKRRMNRFFRENVGGDFIPFPEVDDTHKPF